jgi:hypothetical protein
MNFKQLTLIVLVLALTAITSNLVAQETSNLGFAYDEFAETTTTIALEGEELVEIFFTDQENKLLFVDFEALGEELVELKIVNGIEVILIDDVTELPKNTIYEIDLNAFESKKEYKMLLKTSFGTLTKSFKVN